MARATSGVRIRQAVRRDLPRLLDIHAMAFPDARTPTERERNFLRSAFGPLRCLHVLEEGGVVLAHAFLFAFEAYFGGTRVPVGGIASVGVAPEARGRRLAARLLGHLDTLSRARGDVLTMLYAFRSGFYAQLGYAPTSAYRRLRASPASVPRAWSDLELRPLAVRKQDHAALLALRERHAARSTGCIRRPRALWERILLDESRAWIVVVDRRGRSRGYGSWSLDQGEAHGEVTLLVHELVADDDAARRRLVGVVGAQRDQVTSFAMDVADDDPLPLALVDADRYTHGSADLEHPLGTVAAGPLVKVHVPAEALAARGYAADGELVLQLRDGERLRLEVRGGRGRVTRTRLPAEITLTAQALASLFYGGIAARDAARLGWIEAAGGVLERLQVMLAVPAFFNLDAF